MRNTSKRAEKPALPDPAPVPEQAPAPVPETPRALPSARGAYLISARRGRLAQEANIEPMSAAALQEAVTSMPGVEILRVLPGAEDSAIALRPDEASATYVVAMTAATAEQLQRIAPPHLMIEADQALGYGQKPEAEAAAVAPMGLTPLAPVQRPVAILVINRHGEPLAGVTVKLMDDAGLKEGVTRADGRVLLPLVLLRSPQARYVEVRPSRAYWSRTIVAPDFAFDRDNAIALFALDDADSHEPPRQPLGWGQRLMGLDTMQGASTGQGVRVAVIDSGADARHPLLQHVRHGQDLTGGPRDHGWSDDTVGHGTHCTGVIAARGTAMTGFAPDAEIHALKIFPGGLTSSLLEALDYCITHEIDVVNLSLGTPQITLAVEQKLQEVVASGTACIVAAGNNGTDALYPAASPYVLTVSALGDLRVLPPQASEHNWLIQGKRAGPDGLFSPGFSCHGPAVDLCAPGVGIVSTVPDNGLYPDSGTSMAAPHVTGLAAWLLGHPRLGPLLGERSPLRVSRLYQLLRTLCTPVDADDPLNRFGAGVPQLHHLRRLYPALFHEERIRT